MKTWTKLALAGGSLIAAFVLLLAILPFFFRERIAQGVKGAINERVDARVDFGGVGVSLLRSFPNLRFTLDDLSIVGTGAFDGDTLLHVPRFRLVFDVRSAWRAWRGDEQIVVRSIVVDQPYVHARVRPDGAANWDIAPAADPAAPPAQAPAFKVGLRRLAVNGARIAYDDAQSSLYARLDGLDHTLSGDFTQERFRLRTRTGAAAVSVRQLGVPYLSGARLELRADVDADMANRRFTLKENRLALNELAFALDGAVTLRADNVDLDLIFDAERAAFKDVLSLVPAIYLQDFQGLQASGTVAVGGTVKGSYGADDFPALALRLDVANGMFRYADLPLPARDIFVNIAIVNPGGDADSTVIRLDRLDVTFGEDPFRARARIATPVSDPDVELALNGRIDLAGVGRTLKLKGVEELQGTVTTDAQARTRLSWIQQEQYERVAAAGRIDVKDLIVRGGELPHPLHIDDLGLALSPRHAELTALSARVGSSDFRATGRLENLLGFVLDNQALRGRATLASHYINLDEWQSDDELEVIPVPARLDLALTATIARMTFGDLQMTDARGAVRVQDERMTLENFSLRTLDGQLAMSGWYDTKDLARPGFDFDFALQNVDVRGAAATFNTVRVLAPAASYATGRFSAEVRMAGILQQDMAPVLNELNGHGSFRTHGIGVHGMPALNRLADVISVERLRDPALDDFLASFEVRDGRLHVRPFDLRLAGVRMNVFGSNGIDQSLDYRVVLEIPRALLGAEANRFVSGLLSQTGRVGVDLGSAEAVRLNGLISGTVTSPAVRMDFNDVVGSAAGAVREQLEQRARQEVDRRVEDVTQRLTDTRDEAREQARARAAARADSIIDDAEVRAAQIRAEAERLAENIRREGNAQADRILAEATSPLAQQAARPAAARVRREADERAHQLVREADRRAEQALEEARKRAEQVRGEAEG
jgi:hypothetical protein